MTNAVYSIEHVGSLGFWKGRCVLVTGAAGFIGSWLTRALVELGANVIALVREISSMSLFKHWRLEERSTVVIGDVRDGDLLQRLISAYDVSVCFHLAAHSLVGAAARAPCVAFDVNVRGTWTLLEACRLVGKVSSVIVASSDKAYGEQPSLPYAEDMPLRPTFPYETSKACADLIAQCYATSYNMPVVILRCSNVYGGGDLNFSRIIPGTIKAALHGERPLIRSDGTPMRDYVYIEDVVGAYILAAMKACEGSLIGEAFNIGTGKPITVLELTLLILELCGRSDLEPAIEGLGKPRKEIQHQYVSVEKADRLLCWRPKHTLDEGLIKTIDWYRSFFGISKGSAEI
ncbi:MAG: GDP-mannose 4,6-dehydratase [Armatimonadota bacterium]|nr:GDP-mannose 4,6-dehydratase [Armatimonadota bacterium]MCX7776503.1 GDP-mannose 4,6-dehydratase [Armatimonadota bacterium]MDW8024300.1 GDP-mannose 4,6-dehydratase [Armatimonadota bacterium]